MYRFLLAFSLMKSLRHSLQILYLSIRVMYYCSNTYEADQKRYELLTQSVRGAGFPSLPQSNGQQLLIYCPFTFVMYMTYCSMHSLLHMLQIAVFIPHFAIPWYCIIYNKHGKFQPTQFSLSYFIK